MLLVESDVDGYTPNPFAAKVGAVNANVPSPMYPVATLRPSSRHVEVVSAIVLLEVTGDKECL